MSYSYLYTSGFPFINDNDHFTVLGLEPTTNIEMITKAFRRKCLETHPDKTNGDSTEFIKVQAAYEALINANSDGIDQNGYYSKAMRRDFDANASVEEATQLLNKYFHLFFKKRGFTAPLIGFTVSQRSGPYPSPEEQSISSFIKNIKKSIGINIPDRTYYAAWHYLTLNFKIPYSSKPNSENIFFIKEIEKLFSEYKLVFNVEHRITRIDDAVVSMKLDIFLHNLNFLKLEIAKLEEENCLKELQNMLNAHNKNQKPDLLFGSAKILVDHLERALRKKQYSEYTAQRIFIVIKNVLEKRDKASIDDLANLLKYNSNQNTNMEKIIIGALAVFVGCILFGSSISMLGMGTISLLGLTLNLSGLSAMYLGARLISKGMATSTYNELNNFFTVAKKNLIVDDVLPDYSLSQNVLDKGYVS